MNLKGPHLENGHARRAWRRGFTLLELLVVTTLMALAVGLVTLKLDGFTASGRARSAASQVGSYVRLAQVEARTSGETRIVELDTRRGVVGIRRATSFTQQGHSKEFRLGSRATLTRVWFENECREIQDGAFSIRVDASGRFRKCALLFEAQERFAVCILRCVEPPGVALSAERPRAETLEALLASLDNEAR